MHRSQSQVHWSWQRKKRIQCNGCKAQGIYFESFNFYFQIQRSNKRSDYFQQVTLRVQICLLASSKLFLKVLGSSFWEEWLFDAFSLSLMGIRIFEFNFDCFGIRNWKANQLQALVIHVKSADRVKLMPDSLIEINSDSLNFCVQTWLNHFDSGIISMILAVASMTGDVRTKTQARLRRAKLFQSQATMENS